MLDVFWAGYERFLGVFWADCRKLQALGVVVGVFGAEFAGVDVEYCEVPRGLSPQT